MYRNKIMTLAGLVLLIMVISGFSILNTASMKTPRPDPLAPQDSFTSEWKKVDSLINKGLPQSALEIAGKIYESAKETNNHPQFIKAVLYRIRLTAEFKDEFLESTVADLNEEILEARTPAGQVLNSILADIYWRYFQVNRSKFYDRTTLGTIPGEDIATWDLNILMDRIIGHYFESLREPDALKSIKLGEYDVILDTAVGSKLFRPTLYDFLAHRAIDFFMNDESSILQPAYRFELKEIHDFENVDEFVAAVYQTRDTLSLKFHALLIFQDLLAFHADDRDPSALVDVNLKRLAFVYRNSIHPQKDSLYLNALSGFKSTLMDSPSSAEVSFVLATELYRQGAQYNPLLAEDYRWDAKKALEECGTAMEKFPDSPGGLKCKTLHENIIRSNFRVTMEKENAPGTPMLSLLSYRNISKLHFRLVKLDYQEHREMLRDLRHRDELLEKYVSMNPVVSWEQAVPDEGDFQEHHTEIKVPGVDRGFYLLMGSESDTFRKDSGNIAYQTFWVSNISFISQGLTGGGYKFYVLHRESGEPMPGTDVKMFYRTYDYMSRSYQLKEGGVFKADDNGFFTIPPMADNEKPNSFFLEFTTKDDQFITDDRFYHSGYHSRQEEMKLSTYLFTDRAIYRPGQTVYFKGIIIEKDGEERAVKGGFETTVEFRDVNSQKISELELVTSEYGSFHGSFVVPQGVLNGSMTIMTNTGSRAIQVEEYKRPNFEVTFKPVEGSYKLGGDVKVAGLARSFAGSNVSGGTVNYRVVRETYYPWRFGYFNYYPVRSAMEIANGSVITGDDGGFFIEFEAIPDHTIPAKFKPAFQYTVYADITDINNETQSGTTYVSVGSSALFIDLGLGEVENMETLGAIELKTTNLNGQPVQARGKLTISLLDEPDRLLREQLWRNPDVFVMDQQAFIKDFPFDSYRNENVAESLSVRSVVHEQDFDSGIDSVINLSGVKGWQPGRYRVNVVSKDEFGTDVEVVKYFILFSTKAKIPPVNEMNWFHVLKNSCEPGDKASFIIGSKDRKTQVLYEVIHREKIIHSQWIMLNNEQKLIEVPVVEDYRGGFRINLLFVKHNRVFNNSFAIDVPYTNKQLDVEFITFRNKLTPGQKEEWSLKIKGKSGEKVAAELLTTMYDQSLDKFIGHSWGFNVFTMPYQGGIWNTNSAFHNTTVSKFFMQPMERTRTVMQGYDQLNWFGFNYFGGDMYFRGGRYDMLAQPEGMTAKAVEVAGLAVMEDEVDEQALEEDVQGQGIEAPGSGLQVDSLKTGPASAPEVRRDFRETAFFYPDLHTDENGDVIIRFEAPESLTRWKLMGLAHSRDLKSGQFTREVVTQKELMVIPNAPRFLRQNDILNFTAKVVNLSSGKLEGDVRIRFFNTLTMKEITAEVLPDDNIRTFNLEQGGGQAVSWTLHVPEKYDLITYRITASSPGHSDGEEKPLPVVSNRMLVTESMPLPVRGNETRKFTFKKLKETKEGGSLVNHRLTLEFSSNPAWYAVQALPYMMEEANESADNVFNRFYANTLASYIANANPRIREVFEAWKLNTPGAFLSNLEKNEELKSLILNETPWVRDAASEKEQKQRIALLFDVNRMANEQATALRILLQKQSPGGGWPWFKGMPDNRNITQQIVGGFGHLRQLGVMDGLKDNDTKGMLKKSIRYLDEMIREDYDRLIEHKIDLDKNNLGHLQVQYLYARSFFTGEIDIPSGSRTAVDYYMGQAQKYWSQLGLYQKALVALALNRSDVGDVPAQIIVSIKEYALYSEEMGMYWRDNKGGYYWYEAAVETQASIIEAFREVANDRESVELMKVWLLKQKQTQRWKTPRATAAAVYALLLEGDDWLQSDKLAEITVGDLTLDPFELEDTRVEAGSGYFKTSWSAGEISNSMGDVTVKNENPTLAWGSLYWQYFEDLDKITFAATPLNIDKKLFVRKNTDAGPVLQPLEGSLETGDRIVVRIEIRVDRDMEYVHMKDMRASALEPVNVMSGYRYQGGLGYYESTLDASTNFFFDYLPRGTYVFEYPLVASQKGDFSNGITTIQSMYAPEFTSHSEGIRIVVE